MYNFVFFTDVSDTTIIYKAIGAYKCAHELRKQGYTCLVVDHLHSFSLEEFQHCVDLAVGSDTLAVGFSTTFMMNTNVPSTDQGTTYTALEDGTFFPQGREFQQQALDYIKKLNNNCRTVVGGVKAHPNYSNRSVDYAVIGFAESSIVNLVNHLAHGSELLNSYRNIWGVTIIDDKTSTEYDFKHSSFEWLPTDVVNAQVLPIEIARGCIFKCKFCSYPMNGKQNLDFIRNSDQLRQELQNNYNQFGIRNYYIIDDTFNDSEHKLDQVLEAVKGLTFQPYFWAYTRLDLIATRPHTMQKLYDIGLRGYYFGIETLDAQAGKIIGKGYSRDRMIETIQHIRHTYPDVSMHGSFIIGLPGESLESSRHTADLIINQDIPLHTFNFKGLVLFKDNKVAWNSELSSRYQDFGYEEIPDNESTRIDFNWRNQYITRDQASALAESINQQGYASEHYHIPGQVVWGLLNYGNDYADLQQIRWRQLDWYQITNSKNSFLSNYKKKLFELLTY
jgi:radical SAM superfamily enzyme YgiQ (UPF0313 family)